MRVNHLLASSGISVLRLDHPPGTEHRDSEEEVCANYAANFVDAGTSGLDAEQKSWTLSPGYVFSQPTWYSSPLHTSRRGAIGCLSLSDLFRRFVQEINRADR